MRILGSGGFWRGLVLATAAAGLGCASTNPMADLKNGERAYVEGRQTDAELIWLESLAEAEAYGADDPRLAQSLRMLSNLQIHQGRYDEAKPLPRRWMVIKERGCKTGAGM